MAAVALELIVLFCCSFFVAVVVNGDYELRNLPIVSFEEGLSQAFGDSNLMVLRDGKSVHLTLDERTGSGFMSHDLYLHGFFSASIKLPADYTAGVVVAFYLTNGDNDKYKKNHDEIDFEFLGNIRGKDWRIQTNIYGNGSTNVGREERYGLWFDPSDEFHRYSILWTEEHIIFYVDDIPIREIKRTSEMGGDFPANPMSVYATIWDGSDWATNGGKYRANYKYAPYVAQFSDITLHGCASDPIDNSLKCEDDVPAGSISPSQRTKMSSFRKKHMTYSYCYDRNRYKVAPSECVIDSKEAERLRRFDPVTFGNGHGRPHHRGRRGRGRGHRVAKDDGEKATF